MTMPGSVAASAYSQSTPSWFGSITEAFAEEAQQAVEWAAAVGRRLQDLKPMPAGNSVGRVARHRVPGALQGLFEERNIGRTVDEEHDAVKRDRSDQLLDLKNTSPVRRREATQIHLREFSRWHDARVTPVVRYGDRYWPPRCSPRNC
jgi:hypothetical protein